MEDHWTWISAYLDSELTETQQQHLEQWLEDDPAHQKLFAFQCFVVHSQLQDSLSESRIQESLLKRVKQLAAHPHDGIAGEDWTMEDVSSLLLDAGVPLKDQTASSSKIVRPFYQQHSLAAAVLALGVTLALLLHFWTQRRVVAQVARCVSCQWGADQTQIVGGAVLLEDQVIQLLKGKSQIVFRSGAILNIEGPTKIRLSDPLSCELYAGSVSAFVPAEATGFTVEAGLVKVVDRGTEFTLSALDSGLIKLYVHLGDVDIEMRQPTLNGMDQLRMAERRAVSFDPRSGEFNSLPYEDSVWVPTP